MSQIQTKFIANNAVTVAKIQQLPANTVLGNNTGSTANATSLTVAQTQTLLSIPTNSSPLSVASGGTGLSTLTANNVILGNGTSSPTFVAPGTSGNVLTSNGTTWTSTAASVGANTSLSNLSSTAVNININMNSNKLTSLAAGSAATDSVNYGQVILASGANAWTANQPLGGFTITGSGTPVNPGDLAPKSYVDSVAAGASWHTAVLVATTVNITLSGEQTIDGFLTSSSRVLVKNQTTQSQNGIYISNSSSWTRATDMNAWSQVPAAAVFVQEGTTNADLGFVCTSAPGGTLGTTAITFVQFSSAGAYTADGTTLQLTSGTFSVKNAGITETQIASSALLSTGALTGGSGTKLSVKVDATTVKINGSDNLESTKAISYAYTLTSTDITNQYVDITTGNGFPSSNPVYGTSALTNSVLVVPNGGLQQLKGTDYTVSLTGGSSGSTRITFAGDLANGGNAALIAGDILTISYSYL
jgi:hypothetical protein